MISRNTVQRNVIFEAVGALGTHPTAEEVYSFVSKDYPNISKATVYRNLNLLAETGSLVKIDNVAQADRYDHNLHRHYHLQCDKCGKVYDIEMDYLDDIYRKIKEFNGFEVTDHDIVFKGKCPECK